MKALKYKHMNMNSNMKTALSLSPLFLFLFFSIVQGLNPICDTQDHDSTLKVFHVFSPCSPFRPSKLLSWGDSVLQLEAKDQARLKFLASLAAGKSDVPIASGKQTTQSTTYIVRAKIGTPPQTLLLAIDTSNDAAWLPCTACDGCTSTLFAPENSTTFNNVKCGSPQCNQVPNPGCGSSACTFNLTYGNSFITANVVQDTITLADDPVSNYTFGCVSKTNGTSAPSQGLLGLGRGPLSFLSQTQNLYNSTFSYCLPSFKSSNFSGSLNLGPSARLKKIKFTPLLSNPKRPSLYYVNLVAIKVGSKTVDIPPAAFALNTTTGGGTIFDSGTMYTRLVAPAYTAVRDEFRQRVGANLTVTSVGGFDTCYTVPIDAPTITFKFSGIDVKLPEENVLLRSTAGNTTCLALAQSPDNVNSVLNVIATMQQQNYRVLYDVPNSRLGVARELCTN